MEKKYIQEYKKKQKKLQEDSKNQNGVPIKKKKKKRIKLEDNDILVEMIIDKTNHYDKIIFPILENLKNELFAKFQKMLVQDVEVEDGGETQINVNIIENDQSEEQYRFIINFIYEKIKQQQVKIKNVKPTKIIRYIQSQPPSSSSSDNEEEKDKQTDTNQQNQQEQVLIKDFVNEQTLQEEQEKTEAIEKNNQNLRQNYKRHQSVMHGHQGHKHHSIVKYHHQLILNEFAFIEPIQCCNSQSQLNKSQNYNDLISQMRNFMNSNEQQLLILMGEPGSGKSSFFEKWVLPTQNMLEIDQIPVHLKVSRLYKFLIDERLDLKTKKRQKHYFLIKLGNFYDVQSIQDFVDVIYQGIEMVNEEQVVFFVDGYDEFQKSKFDVVDVFKLDKYQQNKVALSCRTNYLKESEIPILFTFDSNVKESIKKIKCYYIAPFTEEKIKQFMQGFIRIYLKKENKQEVDRLLNDLLQKYKKNSQINKLSYNPLYIRIFLEMDEQISKDLLLIQKKFQTYDDQIQFIDAQINEKNERLYQLKALKQINKIEQETEENIQKGIIKIKKQNSKFQQFLQYQILKKSRVAIQISKQNSEIEKEKERLKEKKEKSKRKTSLSDSKQSQSNSDLESDSDESHSGSLSDSKQSQKSKKKYQQDNIKEIEDLNEGEAQIVKRQSLKRSSQMFFKNNNNNSNNKLQESANFNNMSESKIQMSSSQIRRKSVILISKNASQTQIQEQENELKLKKDDFQNDLDYSDDSESGTSSKKKNEKNEMELSELSSVANKLQGSKVIQKLKGSQGSVSIDQNHSIDLDKDNFKKDGQQLQLKSSLKKIPSSNKIVDDKSKIVKIMDFDDKSDSKKDNQEIAQSVVVSQNTSNVQKHKKVDQKHGIFKRKSSSRKSIKMFQQNLEQETQSVKEEIRSFLQKKDQILMEIRYKQFSYESIKKQDMRMYTRYHVYGDFVQKWFYKKLLLLKENELEQISQKFKLGQKKQESGFFSKIFHKDEQKLSDLETHNQNFKFVYQILKQFNKKICTELFADEIYCFDLEFITSLYSKKKSTMDNYRNKKNLHAHTIDQEKINSHMQFQSLKSKDSEFIQKNDDKINNDLEEVSNELKCLLKSSPLQEIRNDFEIHQCYVTIQKLEQKLKLETETIQKMENEIEKKVIQQENLVNAIESTKNDLEEERFQKQQYLNENIDIDIKLRNYDINQDPDLLNKQQQIKEYKQQKREIEYDLIPQQKILRQKQDEFYKKEREYKQKIQIAYNTLDGFQLQFAYIHQFFIEYFVIEDFIVFCNHIIQNPEQNLEIQHVQDLLLNKKILTIEDVNIIYIIAEYYQYASFVELDILKNKILLAIINLSKKYHEKIKTLSANTASIYNALNLSFSGLDLSKTALEGAMLQQGFMIQTDFTDADLDSVYFYDSNMNRAILNGADMENVHFGRPHEFISHKKGVTQAVFSNNNKYIASSSIDTTVRVWDVESGELLSILKGHTDKVMSVSFSSNDVFIASGSSDQRIILWDAYSGVIDRVILAHGYSIFSIAFCNDNAVLATGSMDNTIKLWDVPKSKYQIKKEEKEKEKERKRQEELIKLKLQEQEQQKIEYEKMQEQKKMNPQLYNIKNQQIANGSSPRKNRQQGNNTPASTINKKIQTPIQRSYLDSPNNSYSKNQKQQIQQSYDATPTSRFQKQINKNNQISQFDDGNVSVQKSENAKNDYNQQEIQKKDSIEESGSSIDNNQVQVTVQSQKDLKKSIKDITDQHVIEKQKQEQKFYSMTQKEQLEYLQNGNEKLKEQLNQMNKKITDQKLDDLIEEEYERQKKQQEALELQKVNQQIKEIKFDGVNLKNTLKHLNSVRCVSFSSDNYYLVSASEDSTAIVWEVSTGNKIQELTGHTDKVTCAKFNSNDSQIATCSDDCTIRIWEALTGKIQLILNKKKNNGHSKKIKTLDYSKDGRFLATAGVDKVIKLWNTQNYDLITNLRGHKAIINSVQFCYDSKYLLSCSGQNYGMRDFSIKLWDIEAETGTNFFKNIQNGHINKIISLAFSPNNQFLCTVCLNNEIKLWRVIDGLLLNTFENVTEKLIKQNLNIVQIQFDLEQQNLFLACDDCQIYIVNIENENLNNQILFSSVFDVQDQFKIEEADLPSSKEAQYQFYKKKEGFQIKKMIISTKQEPKQTNFLVAPQKNYLITWNLYNYTEIMCIPTNCKRILSVILDQDETHLITGSEEGIIQFWFFASQQLVYEIRDIYSPINDLAIQQDFKYIFISTVGARIKRYNVLYKSLEKNMYQEHHKNINQMVSVYQQSESLFGINQNTYLISCSFDETVKIWDSEQKKESIKTLQDHQGFQALCLAVSNNGYYMASGGADNDVNIYRIDGRNIQDPILERILTGKDINFTCVGAEFHNADKLTPFNLQVLEIANIEEDSDDEDDLVVVEVQTKSQKRCQCQMF